MEKINYPIGNVNPTMWEGFNDPSKIENTAPTDITLKVENHTLNIKWCKGSVISLKLDDDKAHTFNEEVTYLYHDDIDTIKWLLDAFSCLQFMFETDVNSPETLLAELKQQAMEGCNERTVQHYTYRTLFLLKVFNDDYDLAIKFYMELYKVYNHYALVLDRMCKRLHNFGDLEFDMPPYGSQYAYSFNVDVLGTPDTYEECFN